MSGHSPFSLLNGCPKGHNAQTSTALERQWVQTLPWAGGTFACCLVFYLVTGFSRGSLSRDSLGQPLV